MPTLTKMTKNPVDLACRVLGVTQTAFAQRLGVSTGLVSQWKIRGRISSKHVMRVVELTGLPANVFNEYFPPTTVVSTTRAGAGREGSAVSD